MGVSQSKAVSYRSARVAIPSTSLAASDPAVVGRDDPPLRVQVSRLLSSLFSAGLLGHSLAPSGPDEPIYDSS